MMSLTRAQPFLDHGKRLWVRFRLNEAAPLLSLAAVSFFAWAFVEIAGEVLEGDTTTLDRAVLLALRTPGNPADPIGPSWLEEGAYFYVCGDARHMAKDVDATLHRIVAEQSGKTPEQAAEYVENLKQQKRYRRDVY